VLVPREEVPVTLHFQGETIDVPHPPSAPAPAVAHPAVPPATPPSGETRRVPLGALVGARSGDKAGNANVGFWVRTPGAWRWLADTVTDANVRAWLGGWTGPIRVHPLPNLLAVNVELVGWLDRGVAANLAPDPQAKGLAEGLRTALVDVDAALLDPV
jgi:hypothetical protein